MEQIDLINNFAKMIVINFFIYLIYQKIINCKNIKSNYIVVFIISVIGAMVYITLNKYIPTLIMIIILYFFYGIIINKFTEDKMNYVVYIFSCVIAYLMYVIATIISGILLLLLFTNVKANNPISLAIIPSITILLYYLIFKTKRFKNGFNFFKSKKINKNIINFTILFTGIVIILYVLCQKTNNEIFNTGLFMGTIILVEGLIIWTKNQITKTYKSRMRDRTIEMQKAEIDENARIIEELKAENIKLASAVHKYNKKFSSLEFAMKNALETGVNTEFANELAVILKETKDASVNFAKEVEIKKNKLPLTNNVGIDNMLKYMQDEARKKDINFEFKLNTSINPLLENAISKDKFETLIGDHLKDAIIAVNASSNSYKSILATLGIIDGVYEFSIYDTGIEFEIETLLKLGQEQVTTHKDEGGSGIGFMTTFETLKQCRASLIIEEYNPETTNYTKAVIIRFDGKNQYKIYSYRAEKIKEQKHKRRIIIEKLK